MTESKPCPFEDCWLCESPQHGIWMHGSESHIPDNITLGDE